MWTYLGSNQRPLQLAPLDIQVGGTGLEPVAFAM